MYIKITNTTNDLIILPFIVGTSIKGILINNYSIKPKDYQFVLRETLENHIDYYYAINTNIETDICLRTIFDFKMIDEKDLQDIIIKYNIKR